MVAVMAITARDPQIVQTPCATCLVPSVRTDRTVIGAEQVQPSLVRISIVDRPVNYFESWQKPLALLHYQGRHLRIRRIAHANATTKTMLIGRPLSSVEMGVVTSKWPASWSVMGLPPE